MINWVKNHKLLLAIISLGFILRIYRIDANTLYGDELTMFYDTYSILKTGHDQTGQFMPITFSMGAGRPGGYIYFSLPFVAIFGPTMWGVRMLSFISGLGIIISTFYLGKLLFDKRIGVIASFLVSISPWAINLSRAGYEANFALFLVLFGITLFLYAKQNHKLYLISSVLLGLALLTYPTYKLTLPLILTTIIWYRGGIYEIFKKTEKYIYVSATIFTLFAMVAYGQTLFINSESRLKDILIFQNTNYQEKIVERVNTDRNLLQFNQNIEKVFHNKIIEYFEFSMRNYIKNFSTEFLFIKGDGNPRHNMSEMGMFYWIDALFLAIGFMILSNKYLRKLVFLLILILIIPITTAITGDPNSSVLDIDVHGLRNAFMLIPTVMISAVGFSYIYSLKNRRLYLLIPIIAIWIFQIVILFENMYFLSPIKNGLHWSWSAKSAVNIINSQNESFNRVFLSTRIDNAEYAYYVYANIDPTLVQREYGKDGIKQFGKVSVGSLGEKELLKYLDSKDKTLLILNGEQEKYDLPNSYTIEAPGGYGDILVVSN